MGALDYQNESLVQAALEKLMQGRTTMIIAHRITTLRKADKIICMSNGKVAEEGTHQELVANGQLYAQCINKQNDMVMQQPGSKDLEWKQRVAEVKAAFQKHDAGAGALLSVLVDDLMVASNASAEKGRTDT